MIRVALTGSVGMGKSTTAGFFAGPYLHPVFGLHQGFEGERSPSCVGVEEPGQHSADFRGPRQEP